MDWEFEAQVDHNHSARFVGLYENDGASIRDTFIMGKVSPRFVDAHYIYDNREPVLQRGGTAIVDYVTSKYSSMIISYWEAYGRCYLGQAGRFQRQEDSLRRCVLDYEGCDGRILRT